ncbi:uncharacterized protein GVI51_I04675 [Nakaseomyces glabratus]|uniref:Altered inheritance of mitochondria protein 11 n=1 Tax=Candida glabrata (strain ATCC 2001 / BCRC 20586 / JCM 3761 / NBRC 0622 / NRRL Y-65 / CBS 138) TaxID=284593 RepID=AIM11_CANGA|nr:uncharacterized protein CAGL0I04928g [Nakaseomyces glabratus]Q6FQN0.1 RecName: Full=Altered inheritance of mitochondria protein 11 [Nakaseomyces glabratus CBS 138]KAH7580737.1 hypothetical protein J7296_04103 [Nakaseomyces glabratus]KAH7585774.1 hypothetical protein J7298_02739 [Nakaseomyces glabratus]KAH7587463.1 hypothetical protein J7297_02737 [Nakaseomyces glabratus]KAH7599406.1 hypothetical protein J7295_02746 [Nakaseomyces glabratus]KAH7599719.1 hypothetical protein J7294_02734 [Naka|eukprot:XP_447464.1 uncharacterized protein CAGL0I04928g [[Candida] glabrata]
MTVPEIISDGKSTRRNLQKLLFFGATSATLAIAALTSRSIATRKYIPTFFQLNTKIPTFSSKSEAQAALGLSSGLSLGIFAITTTGFCWALDISSASDFKQRMKTLFNTIDEKEYMNDSDPETNKIIEELEALINKK